MREIKFRAWDGDKIVSPDYIDRNGVAWWKENSIPTASKEVMQYTGLKDKNGKEVYEGDIVKWGEPPLEAKVRIAEVKIAPDIQFDCKNIKLPFIFHWGRFAYSDSDLTVIGNIHENPELLNK